MSSSPQRSRSPRRNPKPNPRLLSEADKAAKNFLADNPQFLVHAPADFRPRHEKLKSAGACTRNWGLSAGAGGLRSNSRSVDGRRREVGVGPMAGNRGSRTGTSLWFSNGRMDGSSAAGLEAFFRWRRTGSTTVSRLCYCVEVFVCGLC